MGILNRLFGKKEKNPGQAPAATAPQRAPSTTKPPAKQAPSAASSTVIATFSPEKIQAQRATAKDESSAAARIPALVAVCPGVPFLRCLDVSPDGNLVCCVAPDGAVVAFASGTNEQKWSLALPSTKGCLASFVGPQRLLVVSQRGMERWQWQLVNTDDGSVVAKALGPEAFRCGADIRTGVFFALSVWETYVVQTAGDRLEFSTCKNPPGAFTYGPWIGPDGKCYVISNCHVHRLEGSRMSRFMPGDHCICFDPPTRLYCGGGCYDWSGPSALHIGDIKGGETSVVPWGREPIDQIALAGNDRLLLASCPVPTLGPSHPPGVTLLSMASWTKEWKQTIDDLAPLRNVILTVVPEEGWALIESGALLKVVALKDGRTLRTLRKQHSEYIVARWLSSRKLLYIASNRDRTPDWEKPGVLECYSM